MTDPEATDADRQEQQQAVTPDGPELAGEVTAPPDDVPEADGIEQQLSATPGGAGTVRMGDIEATEADALEQQAAVPSDDDDLRE